MLSYFISFPYNILFLSNHQVRWIFGYSSWCKSAHLMLVMEKQQQNTCLMHRDNRFFYPFYMDTYLFSFVILQCWSCLYQNHISSSKNAFNCVTYNDKSSIAVSNKFTNKSLAAKKYVVWIHIIVKWELFGIPCMLKHIY